MVYPSGIYCGARSTDLGMEFLCKLEELVESFL